MKIAAAVVCLGIVISSTLMMSKWSERRGVHDDLCYLRQAHLFQRFGLVGGLDTDISRDDDNMFLRATQDIGLPHWRETPRAICHVDQPGGRHVIQYPPGTGAALALFPEGSQVASLYIAATVLVAAVAIATIAAAPTAPVLWTVAALGWAALYFMINPTKASYSMAPTMVLVALAGLLTAAMTFAAAPRARIAAAAATGLVIGIATTMRLPNVMLAGGYGLFLLCAFAIRRNAETFLRGAAFAGMCLIGLSPVLIANAINTGSALRTTYGPGDAIPPSVDLSVILQYVIDLQGVLLLIVALATVAAMAQRMSAPLRNVGLVVAGNLIVNIGYFFSHPIYTQYYLMPLLMLSLWSLTFALLAQARREAAPAAALLPARSSV